MAFDPQLWGAVGAIVTALGTTVGVLYRALREDAKERLMEAQRSTEVLVLATQAIERSTAAINRFADMVEDNDPRSTPQSRRTYEPR